MWSHKATLIQDISEFIDLLSHAVTPLLQDYHADYGLTVESVVQWIIDEEIERIYLLFPKNHKHNQWPYSVLYEQVRQALSVGLNRYTKHYVRAPALYGDNNEVETYIKGMDLYIKYYRYSVYPPHF